MPQSLLSRSGGVGFANAARSAVVNGPVCVSCNVGRGGPASTAPPTATVRVGTQQRHACRGVAAATNNEMSTAGTNKGSFAASISSAVDAAAPAPYKWSWTEDTEPAPPLDLDAAAVAAAASLQDLTKVLEDAAAAAPPRAALTPAARQQLGAAVQRLLPAPSASCPLDVAAGLLEAYGRVAALPRAMTGLANSLSGPEAGSTTSSSTSSSNSSSSGLVTAVLAAAAPSLAGASARGVADLLWAVSELEEDLPWDHGAAPAAGSAAAAAAAAVPEALQRAVSARLAEQDFLAPDLCRVVCALGSLASSSSSSNGPSTSGTGSGGAAAAAAAVAGQRGFVVSRELVTALNEEVRYQLTEFAADFSAGDLGRLIAGMAGLRLGAAVAGDEEYRRILMKAVYGKTRSIADKSAVDFALSRLMSDDPEARSMHYDSRWTHEELHWLPRRERDKRRILSEGWYRTQWGGWAPGGNR